LNSNNSNDFITEYLDRINIGLQEMTNYGRPTTFAWAKLSSSSPIERLRFNDVDVALFILA